MMPRAHLRTGQAGFSIVEMLVSTSVMLLVTGAVFTLVRPTGGTFEAQPEVADMQQRMRVATDNLYKDLVMAGGGAYSGQNSGSLGYYFATILPYRQGRIGDDPPGTFKTDTITLFYVPPSSAQTSIRDAMPAESAEIKVNYDPGCPDNKDNALCGFEEGMTVLIFDDTGSYDQFSITEIQSDSLHLQHNMDDLSKSYGSGSRIVQIQTHTYYLRTDDANRLYQLMHYDGAATDVPVVDNVVGLTFDYFGDPQPPMMRKPLADPTGPWTTYGPKPPPPAEKPTAYPAGENCAFFNDGTPTAAPRLAVLGPGGDTTTLVQLTQAQLTDGPWCPDAANPNRFDADLLRVRKIGVRIRVESPVDALRGPAGPLFTHGGTAHTGERLVPDQEYRFEVSPRNLNLGR